ncbi:MAG: nuclear transport factor 2 family protein [Actinomycetota bacterium]|nr:nuclear transport factor 2 family protein [Actinomycetota bacterium]MDH5223792.1 nuclear transport factor 2 family protein [Actinomycetota bacterium]MDH5313089.1 nuclear transport factor 2 family protein [Actinomycetota bacterium]
MEEHSNATLIGEMFAAMERGDLQWLEGHIADDIVWHTGGNSRAAGVRRGKAEVREMMGAMTGDAMKADTHDIVANDDHTVVLGTATVTAPSGKSVEYNYVNVFHIAGDKVTEVWGFAENDAETDPIWDEFAAQS